jgi:hypothetical protein
MTGNDASRFLQGAAPMAKVPPLARAVLVLAGFDLLPKFRTRLFR